MNKKELQALKDAGFVGGLSVKDLRVSREAVSKQPGVYIVMRKLSEEIPTFLEKGPCFPHDGKDMNFNVEDLTSNWINGSSVMYIGQTTRQLKKRIDEYIKNGMGKDIGHRGGRAIWQLPDSEELIFYWKPDATPRETEKTMFNEYENYYGSLPFANRTK